MLPSLQWKVPELKAKCEELKIPKSGTKQELLDRIHRRLNEIACNNNAVPTLDNLTESLDRMSIRKREWSKMSMAELKNKLEQYNLPTGGRRKEDVLIRLQSYFDDKVKDCSHFKKVNGPLKVFMVAEKPAMARELAYVLSNGSKVRHMRSSNDVLTVLNFAGKFQDYKAEFYMTHTFGHIFTHNFGESVNSRATDELFTAPVVRMESDKSQKIPKMLAEVAMNCDAVVLWLDCDVEGESICFEVLHCIENVIKPPPGGNVMDVVFRAKFSAVEDAKRAMQTLGRPNVRQHLACVAKHDLDLRIGVAFSRYQTFLLRKFLRGRDIKHVSFGPCQTPCLAFCARQQEAVEKFVSSNSFSIVLTLEIGNCILEVTSSAITDEKEAETMLKRLKAVKQCCVVDVNRKNLVKDPPAALNTVELLKLSSKHLGIGSKDAMTAAEKLYRSGLISYPRTESTKYPKELAFEKRVQTIRSNMGSNVNVDEPMDWQAVTTDEECFNRGVDKGDHPPIIPSGRSMTGNLTEEEKSIYYMICRHFLATFMPEQRYHTETLTLDVNGVAFERRIQEIDDLGFASLIPWERVQQTKLAFGEKSVTKGSFLRVKNVKLNRKINTPPSHLAEHELIGLMEKHCIGTDASIPSHIANIQKRQYVSISGDKRSLIVTPLGVKLIDVYRECVPQLVEPTLRAQFEEQLMRIAKGERDFEDVHSFVLKAFEAQYKVFQQNFHKFTTKFETCFALDPHQDNHRMRNGPNNQGQGKGNQKPQKSATKVPEEKIAARPKAVPHQPRNKNVQPRSKPDNTQKSSTIKRSQPVCSYDSYTGETKRFR